MASEALPPPSYEDLIQLEHEFDAVDLEIIRQQTKLTAPLYQKRQEIISRIPNFWPLVFEQAPADLDRHIQISDSEILADCLTGLEVSRFDLENSPRDISLKFTFSPNKFFENSVLEKKFWFRRARDGWTGLVSEPVPIRWKLGKDLTHNLCSLAYDFFQVEKRSLEACDPTGKGGIITTQTRETWPEYIALRDKLASTADHSQSFFLFFGFISEKRYVTRSESECANAAEKERRENRHLNKQELDEPEEDHADSTADVEISPQGVDIATLIAEDVWPNAIKYLTVAQDLSTQPPSDLDFESGSSAEEEGKDGENKINILSLPQGKRKDTNGSADSKTGSPSKSRKL